ncbi:DNA-binding transcriptional regulator Fis [Buchnera aphidicola (Aphis craccivora)]|uniref:DNA-binding protein Fis n=1 Tax=Buchnera aphidicola (Aphis craccivora) TaxID=466616 RepID=A0A4D6XND7_9GAMM|nr:DNA-binding transcriptional regulator Fis [Buchnera aphidicola]QCI16637.1 DNA-binding transcriptional regulator Fis [Buchnera aphidicola (Aphis craccivora)]QLL40770.1 DNA-binding transcriptional regulator Fis [Buchnera aphidicola (Aphis craccivore)]WAI17610.1 MAG: DNA-binding transcriptional regulator Fis [Buchnera aphidicola (Aphis craccivora)]
MPENLIDKKFLVNFTKDNQNKVIKKPLRLLVKKSLENYLLNLDNTKYINNLYPLILSELEQPLLDVIMQYTRGNQTKAALMMGINRSTLRKKLKKYGMN